MFQLVKILFFSSWTLCGFMFIIFTKSAHTNDFVPKEFFKAYIKILGI